MKISVITVSLNSANTIRDTIDSVIRQDHKNIEYIIIDGGSTDGTFDIITSYSEHVHRMVSEPDQGIYHAMNKGIRLATGDVVGVLNSDDFYAHDAVLSLVNEAFVSSGADIVFGDLVFVDKDDVTRVKRYYSSKKFRPWKLRFGWMPPHPATFIRREAFARAGLYSLDYKIAADYEMLVRLLLGHRCSFFRIPDVLVRMRFGGVSTRGVRSSWLLNREIVKACRQNNIYTNMLFLAPKMPFKLFELFSRP